MENVLQELQREAGCRIVENELLSRHTTMKIGGPCDLFIEPHSIDEMKKTIAILKKHSIPWRAIGRGSNLIISDDGIRGAVIKLGKGLDHLNIDKTAITVGAGYSLVTLATTLSRKGLAGFEFAGGIPGSVGGAVYMNAGAHGSDISNILERARILFPDGSLEWLTNEEMRFSYRTSILQKERPGICVEAVFQLQEGNKEEIMAMMRKYKDYRRDTQPWDYPCSGSVFRNPLPKYAGQLIEAAGLKGYSIGGAMVSTKHANFIVNTGGATTSDVLALIAHIKDVILEKFNVQMETEVEIVK